MDDQTQACSLAVPTHHCGHCGDIVVFLTAIVSYSAGCNILPEERKEMVMYLWGSDGD